MAKPIDTKISKLIIENSKIVEEAPLEDSYYVRKNGEWVEPETHVLIVNSLDDVDPTKLSNGARIFVNDSSIPTSLNMSSRNVGEILYSLLPLTDASLHILDGSILYNNGIYAEFVEYIRQLYNDGQYSNIFVSAAEFEDSLISYGVCGKFVFDPDKLTVRIPKVTGFIEGTISREVIGDVVEAGLPNITGSIGGAQHRSYTKNFSGAFTCREGGERCYNSGTSNSLIYDMDASLSNPIYGASDTVQPQAIRGFMYIVVGTYAKTDIAVSIDNVVNDLKRIEENCSGGGESLVTVHSAMPSNKYIDLEFPIGWGVVKIPDDGYLYLRKSSSADCSYIEFENRTTGAVYTENKFGTKPTIHSLQIPVSKGDEVSINHCFDGDTIFFRFIYCNGNAPKEETG